MDYQLVVLQILGSLAGIIATIVSALKIIRVSQAESRLRKVVYNHITEIIDIGHRLGQYSENDADKQELQKARIIIEESLPLLETDDRKEILTRLNQPSEQGRVNYIRKILGNSYVFQSPLLLLLLRNFAIVLLGGFCLGSYAKSGNILWLILLPPLIILGTIMVMKYNASKIIIRSSTVSIQHGMLFMREIDIPVWMIQLDVRQNLLGRLLNFGTVRFHLDGEIIEMRNVQDVSQLRDILGKKQQQILGGMTSSNFHQNR